MFYLFVLDYKSIRYDFSIIYINDNFENEPINKEIVLLNKFVLLSFPFCSFYLSSA